MKLSPTTGRATTSTTCRKAPSSHKLISALRKSRGSMTPPIAGKESRNSVSGKATSPTTRKTKITVQRISRLKFLSALRKLKAARPGSRSRKPSPTQDKLFLTTLHRAQKASLQVSIIVRKRLLIIKCHPKSFTLIKMKSNFSREWKKWNNLFSMATMHLKWHKWKDQHFTLPIPNSLYLDLVFTIQIKLLKRIESIILIRSIKKLRVFFSA